MSKDFERNYMCKQYELRGKVWENYFESGKVDLAQYDRDVYLLAKGYIEGDEDISSRKTDYFKRLIFKDLVDKDLEVSQLINKIDNMDQYDHDLEEENFKSNYSYMEAMGRLIQDDVLDLMKLRNKKAREYGFEDYVDLVLYVEEIEKLDLENFLNSYLDDNIKRVRYLVGKYNIDYETWFEDVDSLANLKSTSNIRTLIGELLEKLAYVESMETLTIEYVDGGFSGYASEIGPGDIRMAIEDLDSLENIRIVLHELGHCLGYMLNEETGIFRILPSAIDESLAVMFEYIGANILFNKEDLAIVEDIMILDYVRCAISGLYELELWKSPERAEELYSLFYGKLGFDVASSPIWAYDSFRSLDPVYIHNYVIGASLGSKILSYLYENYGNDYRAWGDFLQCKLYRDGARDNLKDKFSFLSD